MSRVLAIGLDAVELDYVERLVDEGALPQLRRLRSRSATARLEVARPYRAEHPWTEFVSGLSADTLGYWSTLTFDPASYRCTLVGAANAKPFYALGSQRRVIALDVPHSRLHGDVDGAQVIGWGGHDPQFPRSSRPAGLLAALENEHGCHPALPIENTGAWNQPVFLDRFATAMIEGARRRVGVVRSLLARVPDWDLLVLGMGEAHTAAHNMWHGVDDRSPLHQAPTAALAGDCLRAIHRALDDSVGEIVSSVPSDTTIVIFSVKGMEPADVDVLSSGLVSELLHRVTFDRSLVRSPTSSSPSTVGPVIIPDTGVRADKFVRLYFADSLRDRFARLARTHWPDATRHYRDLRRRLRTYPEQATPSADFDDVPIDQLEPVPGSLDRWHPACWYRPYWPRMAAFVIPSYSDLHLRINVDGRERSGLVARDAYDRACDEIEELLRGCTNPRTHRPVFSRSTRMRRRDPFAPGGPAADLVIECAEPSDALEHPRVGVIGPFPYPRVGSHTSNGFAWISGPKIAPHELGTRAAIDLPATLLDLLDLRAPAKCEGRSMLPSLRAPGPADARATPGVSGAERSGPAAPQGRGSTGVL